MTNGVGPSARYSMAGDSLAPITMNSGVLAFFGGCNNFLEPFGDMYYLDTGFNFPMFLVNAWSL